MTEEYKGMIKEFSDLRDKLRGMTPSERTKVMDDYISDDFKKDVAMLSGISVKIYAYLGLKYFSDTNENIKEMIAMFAKLDKMSF